MAEQDSLNSGLEALKAGRIDEAIDLLEKATSENPNDFQGFNFLGVAYAQKQLYNRAVGVFLVALRLHPGIVSIHYNLGLAYQADGMPDQAREEFQKALQIDPTYQKALDALKLMSQQNDGLAGQMCARHIEARAVAVCHFCHLAICGQCRSIINGEPYCTKCAPTVQGE